MLSLAVPEVDRPWLRRQFQRLGQDVTVTEITAHRDHLSFNDWWYLPTRGTLVDPAARTYPLRADNDLRDYLNDWYQVCKESTPC